jgi:multidrug resistance protein MdtO
MSAISPAVLCVIISMALQVPELSVTAYMPFFMSKESKFLTTLTGVIGLVGLTIGIGASLLFYKFTYGHPELRGTRTASESPSRLGSASS